jgi:uracil-DNA glycosylase
MNRDDSVRQALRARVEWLQILGVSAVAVGSGRTVAGTAAAAPGAGAATPAERVPTAPVSPSPAPVARREAAALPAAEEPERQDALFASGAPKSEAAGVVEETGRAAVSTPFQIALAAKDPAGLEGLGRIREEIGDCRRCRLCERRTQVVFGVGDPAARLMFIGEGPGADEDAQGEPFVGRAGQLLTKMIEAMGLKRSQVYIANVVKCRPPENRTPLPDEVATCSPFLFRQIAAIAPRVIVCLGTPSAQAVLGTRETITRLRGNFREVGGYRVMPTFHPAYLLRNPAAKRDVWEDLKQVMAALAET